jgi:hypothetical protein
MPSTRQRTQQKTRRSNRGWGESGNTASSELTWTWVRGLQRDGSLLRIVSEERWRRTQRVFSLVVPVLSLIVAVVRFSRRDAVRACAHSRLCADLSSLFSAGQGADCSERFVVVLDSFSRPFSKPSSFTWASSN